MGALEDRYYSVEEYFDILENSEKKLEYHNGKIYGMAGGTSEHNGISVNTITQLNLALREKDCRVYNSDQQVFIEKLNRYVYPDVLVVCGEGDFLDEKKTKLKNPILIVEVLSKSTGAYDKTSKFGLYSKLPSFKEYVLINSERVEVMSYYKESPELWRISTANFLNETIHLYSLGIDISLSDLYFKVDNIKEGYNE